MSKRWCTVVPLHHWGTIEVPFKLADDVVIATSPAWIQSEEILNDLASDDREILKGRRYVLMREYDADSYGDPDREWSGKSPRSKQDKALETIQLANLALWIVKPCSIGFSRILIADCPQGTWNRVYCGRDYPLTPHTNDIGNKLDRNDLILATKLHSTLCLLAKDGVVWIAARTLWVALKQMEWPIRYLHLWIVLEALYGSKDARETTYRLSQRLAFFLSSDRTQAQKLFEVAKRGYSWRSRVAHGMRLARLSPETSRELMYEVEGLARESLRKILLNPEWIKTFSGGKREEHLDALIFSA